MKLEQSLQNFLQTLDQQGILRTRSFHPSEQRKYYLCFCSNDYLSLAHHPEIREFYREGFQRYATGSGSSSLIAGYQSAHKELEEEFCKTLHCEAGLLFSSGYTANLGVMALLGRLQINTLIDKAAHASIYDGLKLGNTRFTRYPHQNIEHLKTKISSNSAIVTEGVFSMSGYQPDLQAITQITDTHDSVILVDEAHSFGIIGPNGLGSVSQAGLSLHQVPLRIIPFGKAFAATGAIVIGKKEWVEVLLQVARSCIYSTAISPAVAYGIQKSLDFITQADEQRHRLRSLVEYFRSQCEDSSFTWLPSSTPIQRIKMGCHKQASFLHQELQKIGINTQLIRYPTVNVPETGLRICITAEHTMDNLDQLFEALNKISKKCYTPEPEPV